MTITYDPRNRANDPFYRTLRRYRPATVRTPHGMLADAPKPRTFLEACADVLALRTKGE